MAITAPESTGTVTLTIDGREVTAPEGVTIWQAAKAAGIDIPVLCHDERFDPVGVCRMCVVDVGAPAFAASCVRACENGMQVKTDTPELERSRAMLTKLLVSDQPPRERDPKQTTTGDNELLALADRYGVTGDDTALPCGSGRGVDLSSPVIAVDHDACILCDRCTRACDDIQGNDVIGRSGKGYATHIAFDLSDPMGASSCVSCGECVAACPTGALTNKPIHDIPIRPRTELDAVDTVLPVLRRGLRADLLRGPRARRDRLRRRPGAARIAGSALRQGPVRLGLRRVAAAPDDAADPPRGVLPQGRAVRRRPRRHGRRRRGQRPRDDERRRPEAEAQGRQARPQARRPRRLRRGAAALPGGHLGRGPGPGGAQAERDLRRGRAGRHRRVRQREVLERGGLPLPEAHPHRLPHQQRGPLHPAVPRLQRGRAVRGDRLRSGLHHLRRHQERRGRDRHRQQLDREPPGRLQLLQAGPPQRHDHHLRGPAGRQDGRPRGHLLPAQARHRRRLLQRHHARGHQARPDRRRLHRQPDLQLRGAEEHGRRLPAGARRADHRRARRADPAGGPGLGRGQGGHHLLGHGDLPAHHRHRQRPLPDRAVRDHRERRQAGRGPAPAARAEQRAGRLRHGPDPDVLPGLRRRPTIPA